MLFGMEIKAATNEGKVVFLRLSSDVYAQLDALKARMNARGVATVVNKIIEGALAEGVTVADEQPEPRPKRKRAA
jgi:hypothetical protein